MSRSLRVKKAVDYTQPGDFEDDDDDFSSRSLRPSKKSRLVASFDDGDNSDKVKRKPEKRASSRPKKSSQDVASSTAAKVAKTAKDERPSLDERLFERDLKKVLALSDDQTEILTSSRESSQEATGSVNLSINDAPAVDANAAAVTAAVQSPRQIKQKETHDCHSEEDDETGESSEPAGESDSDDSDYKKPAAKRSKAPRATSAANRKRAKVAVARAGAKGAARGARADVGPVPGAQQTPIRSPSPVPNKATVRVTASRKPKWAPPAAAGKNNGISPDPTNQSPGSSLRLGLSKRAKLPPLHPGSM